MTYRSPQRQVYNKKSSLISNFRLAEFELNERVRHLSQRLQVDSNKSFGAPATIDVLEGVGGRKVKKKSICNEVWGGTQSVMGA